MTTPTTTTTPADVTTDTPTTADAPPTVRDDTIDHAADLEAIERIIRETETAFNTDDADLLVEHVAHDAVTVGVNGVALHGRDQILDAARSLFAGPLRGQYARYDIDEVRFLRPDVALVHKRAIATDAEGTPIDLDHTMSALYVLTQQDGRWWVVARQNTLIAR
jgi:uncharacterized protein (TIGR02246 family)